MILPPRDNVKTVAALHQQEGATRVVIAALKGGSGDVDIKAAETIQLASGPAALTSLVERYGHVDLVIRVLPASCTVARVSVLPDTADGAATSQESIAEALSLIAETELPAAIPGYRRAAGLINPGKGGGGVGRKPIGLLTAWPTTAEAHPPGAHKAPRIAPEVCISEAASLAILAQAVGGVERAWTIDRSAGAMTILAAGPEKTVVRIARVPAGESGAEARRQAISETSRAAGVNAAAPISDPSWVALDPAPSSPRVAGAARSADWLSQFGLAAAAIIAYADTNPAVSALAGLHEIEPKAKPPILQRVSEFLGSPGRAAALVIFCVLAALAIPIGVSYARVRILEKQVPDEKTLMERNAQDDKELAFARLLREKRWPMTKLLADIASSCPVGINVESVEIGQGDGIILRGVATDTDKLTTFRENLRTTKVFTDPTTPTTSQVATGVQFQLLAKITGNGAIYNAKPIYDFASNTLFKQMYPDATKGPGRATSGRTDRNATRPDRRTNSNGSGGSSRPSTTSRDNPRDTTTSRTTPAPAAKTAPVVIPPALSDADIAKLNHDDAMKEWTNRKRVAAQSGVDEAVKRRLLDESEKAKTRMMETNSGGGK